MLPQSTNHTLMSHQVHRIGCGPNVLFSHGGGDGPFHTATRCELKFHLTNKKELELVLDAPASEKSKERQIIIRIAYDWCDCLPTTLLKAND